MNQHVIELETIARVIFPFVAANVFALVLMYFTLVRQRIGEAYPYFAIFIGCFILFLCSPLIKAVTPKYISLWYVTFKNILLFGVAFPALLYGVYILANSRLSKVKTQILIAIGGCWSLYYLVYRIQYYFRKDPNFDFLKSEVVTLEGTFIGSALYIVFVIILPCIYMLSIKKNRNVRVTLYGVLLLSVGILLGHVFRFWELMNLICSLTAALWCWQIFKDVRTTNRQLTQYHQHEKALAKAQYASADANSFNYYYSVEKNLAYPVREREMLIEAVRTASTGIIDDKVSTLLASLRNFTQHNHQKLVSHLRETLYMLMDAAIFSGANKQELIQRLESKGNEINQLLTVEQLETLLKKECHFLSQTIANVTAQNPDQELVESVKRYVLTHYFNNIHIADIARDVSASQSHIMRVFKRFTQQTINQYIADVRIEKAKLLLLSKSVTDTAYETGFNDSNYFATVFKKKTGVTPKQYQQQASR
jgi:AraC-like DNA-binding protein